MPSKHHVCVQNDVATEMALSAIAAYEDYGEASDWLKENGIICSPAKLEVEARKNREELEVAREKMAEFRERKATNNMRHIIDRSTQAITVAIERTHEKLEDGSCADPSKAGRDLADIMAKSKDAMLALQGRPTVITQDRSIEELTRALVGLGVAQVVDASVEDAEVVEDPQLPPAA